MSFVDFSERVSPAHRIDPRVRITVFVFFSVLICVAANKVLLCAAFIWALGLLGAAGINPVEIRGRLFAVNIFVFLIYLSGAVASCLSGYIPSDAGDAPGLDFYILIILRANTVILMAAALINTMDAVTLGHALAHMKVPEKLAHLFLFSVRYMELMRREYLKMKNAMKARAFRPAFDWRTYKVISGFAAMLLIRGLDHAERVAKAMKCRCFTGRFYMMEHFKMQHSDWSFAFFCGGIWGLMVVLEVLCRIR